MSLGLPYKFPIPEHTHLFETLIQRNVYIENTWILIPSRLLSLIQNFIKFKMNYGSNIERQFYATMTVNQMIKRMYKNRPLAFMGNNDFYRLKDGTEGFGDWEIIGTNQEREPLVLNNYMSYDEIEMSSFLNISIFTPFINQGSRKNYGKIENDCQQNGIYVGQVGARFQKPFKMEWKHMIVDSEQNTIGNGYGPNNTSKNGIFLGIWAIFYEIDYFPLFSEVQNDTTGRFIKLGNNLENGAYLDTLIYKRRIGYSAELFLKEANSRAKKNNKQAYCFAVGLGLGVWKIAEIQNVLTIEVYLEILNYYHFPNISDLYFGWFNITQNDIQIPESINGVKLHIGFKNPAEPLDDPNKLLVLNWAWDANSYIGNEYYIGELASSGDPAAACSSFIAYIANPDLHDIKEVHHY